MSEICRFVHKYVFHLLMSPLISVKEYDAERLERNLCSNDDSISYPSSVSSLLETLTWSRKPASVNVSSIELMARGSPMFCVWRNSYSSSITSGHSRTKPLFVYPSWFRINGESWTMRFIYYRKSLGWSSTNSSAALFDSIASLCSSSIGVPSSLDRNLVAIFSDAHMLLVQRESVTLLRCYVAAVRSRLRCRTFVVWSSRSFKD